MKHLLLLLTALLFAIPAAAQDKHEVKADFKRVPASDFVIFPWGLMPDTDKDNGWGKNENYDSVMKDLYESGLNTTGFIDGKKAKFALPYNLSVFLADPRIQAGETKDKITQESTDETLKTIFSELSPEVRKAVQYVYVRDEPSLADFPMLGLWTNAIRKRNVVPYINLFPEYANTRQLGTETYTRHVDSFVSACKPAFISYDNYSLFRTKDKTPRFDENRFYGNMETIRWKSIEHKISWWNIILANQHYDYANPSDETFRIQVYSTLAYGGRGIGYFTFYSLNEMPQGAIDGGTTRTPTFDMMRAVNRQIHSLAPVYCTLTNRQVYHTDKVPCNGRGQDKAVLLKKISKGPFLVGEFTDSKNNPYLLVVNKNLQAPVVLDIAFHKEGTVKMISPDFEGKVDFTGDRKIIPAGGGVLLTVEDRQETFFQMRGVVVNVHDLSTVDWAKLASEHGINTVGTHMFTAEVAKFIQTEKGQAFLANCQKYGIEVEHQLHSMADLLPRKLFDEDPSMFRMDKDGKRCRDFNFCVHSEKALNIVAKNAADYAKILTPTNHRYYFWLDDGAPVCACPECAKYSASEQAVIVENRIIEELRKLDPKAQLAHLAYANAISAPKKVKPAEGIFLEFAPIHRTWEKPLADGQARSGNNETHAEVLQHLKDNLTVFPAETAVVLEYWLDVSLFSRWKKPAVKCPWHKNVFDSDMATYAELGIRNITTFAVFMDDEYFKAYPDTDYLSEYGNGLKNFVPKKKVP